MSQAVLTSKATILPQQYIHPLNIPELNSEMEQRNRWIFDDVIKDNLVDDMTRPNKPPPSNFIPYYDGELDPPDLNEVYEDPV